MSTNFPTGLDALTNPTSTDTLASVPHADQHANANDAIEELQAKVGANSSAVTTSHDYKLGEVTGTDKAVGKTSTQILTNKTLTRPVINVGSDATGDIYYRNSGVLTRLSVGTSGQALISDGTLPVYATLASNTDASTTVKGVVEIATVAEITTGTSTGATGATLVVPASAVGSAGANKIVQLNASSQLPAVDGSLLTNLLSYKTYRKAGIADPGSTAETSIFTQVITGGDLSATGAIRVTTPFIINSVASGYTTTIRLKFGGSTLATLVVSSPGIGGGTDAPLVGSLETFIINNASVSSQNVGLYTFAGNQVKGGNITGASVATQPADTTSSINTASNQTLEITVQKSVSTGTVTFYQSLVVTNKN